MASVKKLIRMLLAGNSRHIPFRNTYYMCCHNLIVQSLNKRAEKALPISSLLNQLSALTSITLPLDVDEKEKGVIVSEADKTMAGIFNLLGSGDVKLDPIPWSKDFISGYEWKKGTYYRKYIQVDLSNHADVKVPRELSRCHHLLHLALAYNFTSEKKYARTVVEHIVNWIEENPLMYSINWCCAMDVAIRAVNWIWSLSLLNNFEVTDEELKIIRNSLYQHGWFIYNNLEGANYEYNNNHYFSDIVGLLHIGLLFREDFTAQKWLQFAIDSFYRETRLQVLPSGMSFEGSTNYHRLVTELVLTSVILLRRNGIHVPPDIVYRLENMVEFVMRLTLPDGTMPVIGDQDNGRLLPWGIENINDHRYLLTVGALVFDRGDFKYYGSGYNVYAAIFSSISSRILYNRIVTNQTLIKSFYFKDAGLVLMRDGNNSLLFNVDNQGMYRDSYNGSSHTHCDWFSFVLAVNKTAFIVDPGSYVYSSDAHARNHFRSTCMHNTIVVDGKDQVEINECLLWRMKRDTSPQIIKWRTNDQFDLIECAHDGFRKLDDNIRHQRSVFFDKQSVEWLVTDNISAKSGHNFIAYFHLDTNVHADIVGRTVMLKKKDTTIELHFETESDIEVLLVDDVVSKGYGSSENSKTILVKTKKINDFNLETRIWERKD